MTRLCAATGSFLLRVLWPSKDPPREMSVAMRGKDEILCSLDPKKTSKCESTRKYCSISGLQTFRPLWSESERDREEKRNQILQLTGNPFFEKIEKIRIHNRRNLRLATLGIVGEVCEALGIAFYISHSIVRHLETTEDEPTEKNYKNYLF